MGSKTQQSTSTSSTTPTNIAGLQSIFNQVQGAASTPYQAYNGELTAGINGQQTQGINNINANAGYANPFFQQASGLVQGAANPLTASQIQNYQNPYTQQVVDATQAQFAKSNAEGQNSLKGNAAIAGALGGDRQAVAQAQLAGQQATAQAPVIANLYSQGYNNAVNTAQQQYQQNPLAQANALANYGVSGQNAALQGANAQIGAGTLQQGTQQAQDQAAYQQYLQRQGYPFQTAQFFSQYGLPSAVAQGSSSTGTQTTPGPNTAAQIAGLGISAAGLFLKDGGSVNGYAAGGSPFNFIEDAKGYVPISQGVPSAQLPTSQLQFAKPSAEQQNPWSTSISGLGKMQGTFAGPEYGGGNIFTDASGGSSDSPLEGLSKSDYGEGFKVGGFVDAIHQIRHSIKRSRGGSVGTSPLATYADGGSPTFDDRFSAAFDPMPRQADSDVVNPGDPIRMPSPEAVQAWRDDTNNRALVADSGVQAPAAPVSSPSPMQVALPKQISNPDSVPDEEPSSALAYDAKSPLAISPSGAPAAPAQGQFGHSLFGANLSDKTRQSLVAAGLGMLASKSPFFGTALGEGGLKGLGAYSDLTKQEQDVANQAATKAQNQQRIDMEAKRLSQSAEEFTKNYGLAKRRVDLAEDKTPAGYRATKDGMEPIPGGPADPEEVSKLTKAKQNAGGLSDTAKDIKARQMINGDMSWATNLGRGAQAGRTLEEVSNHAADILTQEGGMSPTEAASHLSKKLQEFKASGTYKNTEARTAAGREANLNLILNATEAAIPAALEASEAVSRTGWVPINKVIQHGQVIASSPELKRFGMANLQLAEHWARAMNPLGVMRESDRDKALEYLNTADSKETYKAAVDQLHKQILRERDAVRQGSSAPSPNATPAGASPSGAPAAPAPPASKPASVIQNGHTYTLQPDGSYK